MVILTSEQLRVLLSGQPLDVSELKLTETVTVRKFGGEEPSACREEDCEEEIHITRENDAVVSRATRIRASDGAWVETTEGGH